MTSTVTVRGQTAIPIYIRKRYHIKPKALLEWIDDGHTITVMPIPCDPIKALRGLHRGAGWGEALLKSRSEER
jgi:bifunctional DNA-binding transcriptional regulator/antitoxin component of YhaV-PrlF toxin-antitoxin module